MLLGMSRHTYRSVLITFLLLMMILTERGWAATQESVVYTDGNGVIYRVDPAGSDKTAILTQLPASASRAIPRGDGLRVFTYANVYLESKTDGTGVNSLATPGFSYSSGYAVSPDGTKIAFAGKSVQTYLSVYTMNADGSGAPTQLTTATRHEAVLDWGGPGILYRSFHNGTLAYPLHRVDPGTGISTAIGPLNFSVIDARYNPTYDRIALIGQYRGVVGGNRLFLMNADGTGISELVTNPLLNPNAVDWAPDGSNQVVLSGYDPALNGGYAIYLVDLTTGTAGLVVGGSGTNPTNFVTWGLLDDPVAPTTLTVPARSGQYSDSLNLSATLLSGGAGLSGEQVDFRVDGFLVGSAITNGVGVATLPLVIGSPAGSYVVDAEFAGTAGFGSSFGSSTLTVSHETVVLSYTGDLVTGGGPLTLSASLAQQADGSAGDITLTGSLQFTVSRLSDGVLVGTYLAPVGGAGSAATATPPLPQEPYQIQVSLPTNGYFVAPSIAQAVQVVTALPTDDASGEYGDVVTLRAVLSPAVPGKTILFRVNGSVVGSGVTDALGEALLNYAIAPGAGIHTIQASFAGDAGYVSAADTATLTVVQESATLAYTGDTLALGGAFRLESQVTQDPDGSLGDRNLAGSVEFVLTHASDGTAAGTFVAVVDGAGVAGVNLGGLPARSYDVQVSLLPNNYFSALPVAAVIQTQPVLMVDDLSGQYSDAVTLRSALTADGGGLAGRTVFFTVNGVAAGSGVTDGSGVATALYTVNQGVGTYVIAATFAGDGTYTATSGSGDLIVTREDATLAYTGDVTTGGGALGLSATVTEIADGGVGDISQAGTVQFVVSRVSDGVVVGTYAGAVNGAGVASTNTGVLPSHAYSIAVSLLANNYYVAAPVGGHVQGQAALVVDDLTGQYSDSVVLRVVFSPAIAGKTVSFRVDGALAGSGVTNAAGVAMVSYSIALDAGVYLIEADFAGDADYTAAANIGTLTVVEESATLAYSGGLISTGGAFTLSTGLTQQVDGSPGNVALAGTIAFVVARVSDGVVVGTYVAAVDGLGAASTALGGLAADAYDVTVSLLPNGYFAAAPVVARIKGGTAVSVANVGGVYSDAVNLSATLTRSGGTGLGGQTVSFTVNGAAAGSGVTDGAGVATASYTVPFGAGSPSWQHLLATRTMAPARATAP